MDPVQKHSVHTLVFRSLKRTHDTFICNQPLPPSACETSRKILITTKNRDQYGPVLDMPVEKPVRTVASGDQRSGENRLVLAERSGRESRLIHEGNPDRNVVQIGGEKLLVPKRAPEALRPDWHAPWKLFRVLSGHTGWVRCLAVDPTNEFFATGAADRMIKIWDLASGILKLTLTGHISAVRGVALSARNPYLFSCGEDKTVRCWDLEQNKVIRNYHGHMSAVYGLALHPTVDIVVTCGRDATVHVWDMRTKVSIHTLTGHTNTVAAVCCQETEPQIISGSHDSTVRLWDLVAGKTHVCLTNHKKSVRAIALHPSQHTFASASPDNIKQWQFPDGKFLHNLSGHNAIVNALTINEENVVVSGGDNGSLHFWDWKSGYNFQRIQTQTQPGSIDSDAGIFALCFDRSGSRLLTAEADKTIKVYKEDETATEETHPIKASALKRAKY